MPKQITETREMLAEVAELSHEFGTDAYLKGGGGNSSAKDGATLWVKPSGTALISIKPEDFLPMVRERMADVYKLKAPAASNAREAMIKEAMQAAVQPGAEGRASVEAPLHESINARYVMHTHPVLVNGMTCAKKGAEVCADLFPDHLWVEYVDPGYTLCMELRKRIAAFESRNGRQPEAIFLKNHGLFVGADTAERLREIHGEIMQAMRSQYQKAGLSSDLKKGTPSSDEDVASDIKKIKKLLKQDAAYVCSSEPFEIAVGPVTPDHVVYHKAFPFVDELRPDTVSEFKKTRGYAPRIIKTAAGVFAAAPEARSAELALELAIDGAQVAALAEAFGGVEYMTDKAADFIDNWEVEAYRRSQMQNA